LEINHTISNKLEQLTPEEIKEVEDFIDFLVYRGSSNWTESPADGETGILAETGMESYLRDLEIYEGQLARGEIKW
jgi:hypothetical protein